MMARTHARTHARTALVRLFVAGLWCALVTAFGAGCSVSPDGQDRPTESIVQQSISGSNAIIDNTGASSLNIRAVGQLQLTNGTCSGTLVTPTTVLTAGHCFNGVPSAGAGKFVLPTGDPISGNVNGPGFTIKSWKRIANGSDKPHDVACATLTSAVPNTVVPVYPRVHLGGVYSGWHNHLVRLPGWFAGFGSYIVTPAGTPAFPPGQQPVQDGNRRYGAAASDTQPELDACGDFNEQHCNDDYEWESDRIVNPQFEKGDSGGPLFMDSDLGDIVVGVASGFYRDDPPKDTTPHSVWAPTGAPGHLNNAAWIAANCLGGDADGDGVGDSVDNCPPSRCANSATLKPADCVNPDQIDLDNDGVGEKCDNCPGSLCHFLDTIGAHPSSVACKNPGQGDYDLDGRGDACDLCPGTGEGIPVFAPSAEPDSDGDGVGDACDLCEQKDPYASCQDASDCYSNICFIEPGAPSGNCSEPTDSDGDGVADKCDECPGYQTPDRTNSNTIAEEREIQSDPSLLKLADACDAVPLIRVPAQKLESITIQQLGQYTPGDGVDPDDVATIPINTWLGVDLDAPAKTTTVDRRAAYRHCDCLSSTGFPIQDLEQCVKVSGACPPGNPTSDSTHWAKIKVNDGTASPFLDGAGITLSPTSFKTGQTLSNIVYWNWREDVLAGQVTGLGLCPGQSAIDCRTHGALYTGTQRTAPFASAREQSHVLGDIFQMIDTPGFRLELDIPFDVPACKPPCLAWVFPDFLKDPDPFGFTDLFDHPSPLNVTAQGNVAALVNPATAVDVSSYLDAQTKEILATGALWLTAVEPLQTARYSGSAAVRSGVHTVVMARDYTGDTPVALATTSNGLHALPRGLPYDPPPVLHGVRGVFSAVESAAYMVGGTLENGLAAGSVWRWSLEQQDWSLVPLMARHVPSSNVLSVGYDPNGQHLYVLDIDDDDRLKLPHASLSFARLYRIDLASGTSTQLLRVPHVGKADFSAIAVMSDGLLAVVSATKKHYKVWRVDAAGAHAVFRGVLVGNGRVIDAPVMGEDRLYLPVAHGDKLDLVELGSGSFHGHTPCNSL